MYRSIILILVLGVVGCGGGSSGGSEDEDVSVTEPEPITEPAPDSAPEQDQEPLPEPATGLDLVNGIEIERFETFDDAITIDITGFSVSDRGSPQIELLISNSSAEGSIRNASCDVTAFDGNELIDISFARFATPLGPLESTSDTIEWVELEDGFASVDRITVDCDWIDGATLPNIITGSVAVRFIEYTFSEFGDDVPAVTLQLTNNSGSTIFGAFCLVEAKRGNFIVDTALVIFASQGDIAPGEAFQGTGSWPSIDSFDEFESDDELDLNDVNCSFFTRS